MNSVKPLHCSVVVKVGDFLKFKGSCTGISRDQALQKNQKKSPKQCTFLSLTFSNAPSLDAVDQRCRTNPSLPQLMEKS